MRRRDSDSACIRTEPGTINRHRRRLFQGRAGPFTDLFAVHAFPSFVAMTFWLDRYTEYIVCPFASTM
ncbi:hypothetical protein JCM13591A_20330 [Microbacterium xylanilyticum]